MTEQEQKENGFVYYREVSHGKYLAVVPRPFNSILVIGDADNSRYYDTHYCYTTPGEAIIAAEDWDPAQHKEPDGWFRHADTGRRRPDGDRTKEYIAP
jgi:hypothetical protein